MHSPPINHHRKWPLVLASFMIIVVLGLFLISRSRTFQFFAEIVPRVKTSKNLVALTFDDGPTPKNTPVILDILRKKDVKATFFVIGGDLEKTMDIGRQLVQEGHCLGNHSYSHHRMVLVSQDFIASEIDRTDELIRQTGFSGPIFFRPPYGKKLFGLPSFLHKTNRLTVTWDIEPESDPAIAGSASAIIADVVSRVRPGSIILLHGMYESGKTTIEALPALIDAVHGKGFRFTTVSDLLASRD